MTTDELWLRTIAKKNSLPITDIKLSRLSHYCSLLKEWNGKINLISRKDEENVWANHILVSLIFLFKIDFPKEARILDLGTGGGLPGIPVGVVREDLDIVMVDSIRKKTVAVADMVRSLGLPNLHVDCGRAEELGKTKKYVETFDAVIARGVSSLDNLVRWAMPFLKHSTAPTTTASPGLQKIPLNCPALATLKGGTLENEIQRARKRFPSISVRSFEAMVEGDEPLQHYDKKLILVEYNCR